MRISLSSKLLSLFFAIVLISPTTTLAENELYGEFSIPLDSSASEVVDIINGGFAQVFSAGHISRDSALKWSRELSAAILSLQEGIDLIPYAIIRNHYLSGSAVITISDIGDLLDYHEETLLPPGAAPIGVPPSLLVTLTQLAEQSPEEFRDDLADVEDNPDSGSSGWSLGEDSSSADKPTFGVGTDIADNLGLGGLGGGVGAGGSVGDGNFSFNYGVAAVPNPQGTPSGPVNGFALIGISFSF